MEKIIHKFKLVFADPLLRKRIFFTVAILMVFRVLAAIPIPGVNLAQLGNFFANSDLLGVLNIFSGGGLSNLSIVMLGVGPYITASIIMQLLTMVFPKLKEMYREEGDRGRLKFAQYSRRLTVPLALIQAYGFLAILIPQNLVASLSGLQMLVNVVIIAAGSILLMWMGELITEYGIGNGVSLIIFGGIVASIPTQLLQFQFQSDVSQLPLYIAFIIIAVAVVYAVVVVNEAERAVPITYAKRVRGMKVYGGISTYLPLRLNQAGVMPIIFALSILLFPQWVFNFLSRSSVEALQAISKVGLSIVNNQLLYTVSYFVLVLLFTYFYTAVTFDPQLISNNLQKSGAFIPGVRPGQSTSEYLGKIITRITLVGALFLGIIAVLPFVVRSVTNITSLAIGGTALLIVVSVIIDLVKKIDAQVSMREY